MHTYTFFYVAQLRACCACACCACACACACRYRKLSVRTHRSLGSLMDLAHSLQGDFTHLELNNQSEILDWQHSRRRMRSSRYMNTSILHTLAHVCDGFDVLRVCMQHLKQEVGGSLCVLCVLCV